MPPSSHGTFPSLQPLRPFRPFAPHSPRAEEPLHLEDLEDKGPTTDDEERNADIKDEGADKEKPKKMGTEGPTNKRLRMRLTKEILLVLIGRGREIKGH